MRSRISWEHSLKDRARGFEEAICLDGRRLDHAVSTDPLHFAANVEVDGGALLSVMKKAAEEGEIWEWRAFGNPDAPTLEFIRSRPIRMAVKDLAGEDLYLISPVSDQNVKLRRWNGEWVLKFKLLLTTTTRGVELYGETAGWVYQFPVERQLLVQAGRLLGIKLADFGESPTALSANDFIAALSQGTPPAISVRVAKVRTQFEVDGGWLELTEVSFPSRTTNSLSIHSTDLRVVERTLDQIGSLENLEVMNYVEACRRWR